MRIGVLIQKETFGLYQTKKSYNSQLVKLTERGLYNIRGMGEENSDGVCSMIGPWSNR